MSLANLRAVSTFAHEVRNVPCHFGGAREADSSASSASFIHSSAKTRHVTLRTSSTAASTRCRHFSAERRQCAGKFSVSWTALTGPSRRRARRNRRLLWPSLALWLGTCDSVRALFRDWPPGIYGSSGGSFTICGTPLLIELSGLVPIAARHFRRHSRRFSGSLYGTYPPAQFAGLQIPLSGDSTQARPTCSFRGRLFKSTMLPAASAPMVSSTPASPHAPPSRHPARLGARGQTRRLPADPAARRRGRAPVHPPRVPRPSCGRNRSRWTGADGLALFDALHWPG
jgi:hypothetical protein